MAQGVAWSAREMGVPAAVVVPDHAPATKLAAIERLGGQIIKVPFERWWQVLHGALATRGSTACSSIRWPTAAVMAGNGTIALEILEDLPDVDTVLVPFGGGGLSCGIASALAALRPEARVFGCEVETAAPLSASLAAGSPQTVDYHAELRRRHRRQEPSPRDVAAGEHAARRIPRRLPGTGGCRRPPSGRAPPRHRRGRRWRRPSPPPWRAVPEARKVVCIVSGGNIDAGKLCAILDGRVP